MSCFRCNDVGMVPIAIPDGRRGLWTRETKDANALPVRLEICAGREGDDSYVFLTAGVAPTSHDLYELQDALLCLGYAFDLGTDLRHVRSRIRTTPHATNSRFHRSRIGGPA